jgi:hypothetical protein
VIYGDYFSLIPADVVVPVFQGEHNSCSFNSTYELYDHKHDYQFIASHDCTGAIDSTHMTSRVPKAQASTFRRRKHYISQNVLACVDFDLMFAYVFAGWEVSSHDASILTDSLSRPNGLEIPDGKFYIGDVGYAC